MKPRKTILNLVLLSLWIFTTPVNAQQSVSDFLLTAFESPNLSQYDQQIDFLNSRPYRIPPVNDLELRFGNDELTHEDQQYALRFRPTNPWLIRRTNALFNATRDQLTARRQLEFKENMADRYDVVIQYFYNSELAKLINEQLRLAEAKSDIYQNNVESDLFDAKDYVDAKLDQVDVIQELDENLIDLTKQQQTISTILGTDTFDWSDFDLISVTSIDSISSTIAAASFSSAELNLIAKKIEVAKQETRVEKADFDIGFLQAEYFPFRDRNSDIGFAFGISIPIFRDNKPQMAERKLDEIEFKNEFQAQSYRDSLNRILQYEHLKNLLNHHRLIEEKIEALDIESLLRNLSRAENYDPIITIELKEGLERLNEVRLKSKHRVLEQYLNFLLAFDVVIQQPLKNYLSENFDSIE